MVFVLDPFQDGRSGLRLRGEPGRRPLRRARAAGRRGRRQELGRRVGGRHRARRRGLDGRDPDPDRDAQLPARPRASGASTSSGGSSGCRRPTAGRARGRTTRSSRRAGPACSPGFPASISAWASACGRRSSAVSRTRAPDAPTDGTLEPSLDVTQRLGANALASLTVNTDFAETEVDTRQTNLTRFPLFFPEKRTFFLEAADIFAFGVRHRGRSLLPFFSRRIGLVEGQEVPILAGLKATGRVGQTNFGGLVVRTREETGVAPASTMAVVRVKQNVLAESSRRLHRDTRRSPGPQRELGSRGGLHVPDLALPRRQELQRRRVGPRHGPRRPRRASTTDGVGAQGRLPERPVGLRRSSTDASATASTRRSASFPGAGSTATSAAAPTRRGRRAPSSARCSTSSTRALITDLGGRWESYRVFMAPVNWRLESGDRFEFNVVPAGERLMEPFEIGDGGRDPARVLRLAPLPGRGGDRQPSASSPARPPGGSAASTRGTLDQFELEAAWTPSPHRDLPAERRAQHRPPASRATST